MKGKTGKAFYGFGDASGKSYGFLLEIDGVMYSEFWLIWEASIEEKHSNFIELFNLVNAVEAGYVQGALCKLYIFTDNFVAKSSYYNGGSNQSKELDNLVYRLWQMQMNSDFSLFVCHVAGTRMIEWSNLELMDYHMATRLKA